MKIPALLILSSLALLAQSDGKFVFRGRVVDDLNDQAVRTARIILTGGANPLIAQSDDRGAFSFADVPPGRYKLNIEKAGYFTPIVQDIQAAASSSLDLGDIPLTRTRAISGTVRWSDGEPAGGITVQILPVVAGKPVYRGIATGARTDERGSYRIPNVRPGRYVAFASSAQGSLSDDLRPRLAMPVFYPGSDALAGGLRIDLRKTKEATDISFRLQEKAGVTVDGVVAPSAEFPAGTDVLLGLMVPNIPTSLFGMRQMRAGDAFRFFDIPEGAYLLVVSTRRELYRGYQSIQVGRQPLTGVRVNLPEPAPVVMKVEMLERDGTRTSPVKGISIRGQLDKLGSFGNSVSGAASAVQPLSNGDLQKTDIAPGETYSMEFRGVPADAYVESVAQGGREQKGGPFEFVATTEPVRILLKKDGGTINGVVRDGNRGPAPKAFVVLAPRNRKATNRFLTAAADKDGNFKIAAIAPGDYDLFAFDQNDEDSYLEEDYLRAVSARATGVQVDPNSAQTFQPELIRVTAR